MPAVSKTAFWIGWVISGLAIAFLLFGVVFALVSPEAVKEGMAKYGYPEPAGRWLVIVELICLLLYIIPQTAVLGAILLTGYLGGATATHVRVSEAFFLPVIVGVLLWLGLFLREPRLRGLVPWRRSPAR